MSCQLDLILLREDGQTFEFGLLRNFAYLRTTA